MIFDLPRFTKAAFSPCEFSNNTAIYELLASRFPKTNFGAKNKFQPSSFLDYIQVLIGYVPDITVADPSFSWPDSLATVDFYFPSLEFNQQLQQQLEKRFPGVDFSSFDPSRYQPYILAFFGMGPPPPTISKYETKSFVSILATTRLSSNSFVTGGTTAVRLRSAQAVWKI